MYQNSFTGTIPSEIGSMTSLGEFVDWREKANTERKKNAILTFACVCVCSGCSFVPEQNKGYNTRRVVFQQAQSEAFVAGRYGVDGYAEPQRARAGSFADAPCGTERPPGLYPHRVGHAGEFAGLVVAIQQLCRGGSAVHLSKRWARPAGLSQCRLWTRRQPGPTLRLLPFLLRSSHANLPTDRTSRFQHLINIYIYIYVCVCLFSLYLSLVCTLYEFN